MDWRHRTGEQRPQLFAPLLEGFGPPIAVSFARQVEKRTIDARLSRKEVLPARQLDESEAVISRTCAWINFCFINGRLMRRPETNVKGRSLV